MVTPVIVERIVTVEARALLWSVAERAVMATVFLAGTATGAVKVVVPPLGVCAGEKVPQFGALPQVATQSTPALAISPVTVAETWVVPPTFKEVAGVWVIAIEMIGVCEDAELAALVEHPAIPIIDATESRTGRTARSQILELEEARSLRGRLPTINFPTESVPPIEIM
jgi:hypothetical protein